MRNTKIVLIGILVILAISITVLMGFALSGENQWIKTGYLKPELYLTEEFSDKEIESLSIDSNDYDVDILLNSGNTVKVEAYYTKKLKEEKKVKLSLENGQLKVKTPNTNRFLFFSWNQRGKLTVSLPEKLRETITDCYIHTTSGDVTWDKNLKLSAMKRAEIETVSGDITLTHLDAEEFSVRAVSGDIHVMKSSGEFSCTSVSGDIHLNIVEGKGLINTTSGDLKLSLQTMTDEIKIKSISGDVNVHLQENGKANIITNSISGSVSTASYSDKNGKILDISTVSGDITVASLEH